jgi:hypothetical protein
MTCACRGRDRNALCSSFLMPVRRPAQIPARVMQPNETLAGRRATHHWRTEVAMHCEGAVTFDEREEHSSMTVRAAAGRTWPPCAQQ